MVAAVNKKAKYRIHYERRINDIKILGLGRFLQTPTDRIAGKGSRIARENSTFDLGLEFLYAPTMQFENTQYTYYAPDDTVGVLKSIPQKHLGFRIRTEVKQKILSLRIEMGLRPGPKLGIGDQDNVFTRKYLAGGYVIFGVGFGLGLL